MAHPELVAQSEQFAKDVIEVSPGVWTAVGFAASNVHMIIGDTQLIIVDTTESTTAAQNILAEFRKITDKPVAKIIYTHSHRDHISGATVFAEGGAPEIIASAKFNSDLVGATKGPNKAMMNRTRHQFGIGLSFPDERVNLGCGPGDRPMKGMGEGHIPPQTLIDAPRTEITFDGITLELISAPGETPDHIAVWLPDQKVLIPGDNFYHSFPNLYPIRGSSYRDFNAWANTLEQLAELNAEVMALGHTRPVVGAEAIRDRLLSYSDAIRHVIGATADGLNAGRSLDDLAHEISLPPKLAAKPWLTEFYGKVSWSVRAYAGGTLGWFDGNPTNLARLSPADEAARIIVLAGGADAVLAAARDADDPQWTLELVDRLLAVGAHTDAATELKAQAMKTLADAEINATARNYYLVAAKDLLA